MQLSAEQRDFIRNGDKYYLPGILIGCVIFGYHDKQLKVLLGRRSDPGDWVFPGGFIKKEESLSAAAARILKERTSLDNIFLQQFHTFGDLQEGASDWRSRTFSPAFIQEFGADNWLLRRSISVGYYALIDYSLAEVRPDLLYNEFCWHNIADLPQPFFDQEMLDRALNTLRNQLYLQPIGHNLLPEKFTLPEIHVLYETILNKKLDRRNFPNKLMSLGILVKLEEKRRIGQHRSPFLYKFDKENYEAALRDGVVLTF